MEHDELGAFFTARWTNSPSHAAADVPSRRERDRAERRPYVGYAKAVGGTSFHFTGQLLALSPDRLQRVFEARGVPGAALADWPITYEELEPYYTAVEWAIGVSGTRETQRRASRCARGRTRCRRST